MKILSTQLIAASLRRAPRASALRSQFSTLSIDVEEYQAYHEAYHKALDQKALSNKARLSVAYVELASKPIVSQLLYNNLKVLGCESKKLAGATGHGVSAMESQQRAEAALTKASQK